MLTCFWIGPLFPFPWFSGWCVFLGSVFRGFSRSALVCNLRAWVSSIALIAWITDKYVYIFKINGLYYLQIFRGWGLLVLCVVADGFCLGVAFTFVGGECLHTTGLRFGRLVTMSLSVLYGGFCSFMSLTADFLKGMF
jgi:hypothetical protein